MTANPTSHTAVKGTTDRPPPAKENAGMATPSSTDPINSERRRASRHHNFSSRPTTAPIGPRERARPSSRPRRELVEGPVDTDPTVRRRASSGAQAASRTATSTTSPSSGATVATRSRRAAPRMDSAAHPEGNARTAVVRVGDWRWSSTGPIASNT